MQERFHNVGPGDFEGTFSKTRDSDTRNGPKIEETTGKSLGGVALDL